VLVFPARRRSGDETDPGERPSSADRSLPAPAFCDAFPPFPRRTIDDELTIAFFFWLCNHRLARSVPPEEEEDCDGDSEAGEWEAGGGPRDAWTSLSGAGFFTWLVWLLVGCFPLREAEERELSVCEWRQSLHFPGAHRFGEKSAQSQPLVAQGAIFENERLK
jgi:hypothetical protein